MSGKIAVVQGSFDPITVGHADIVRRTAAWFDRIFVAVAQNAEKQHMFSPVQRAQLACAALKELENVSVEICDGYVADFAIEKHAASRIPNSGRRVQYLHFYRNQRLSGRH